ncbi:hypothetical protein K3495_g1969 [Podosphaera aphanis]|nr:hypothetical protein K3495_g1969 [Podosphaera aphanis]
MRKVLGFRNIKLRKNNVVRLPPKILEKPSASSLGIKYQTSGIKLMEPIIKKPPKNNTNKAPKIVPVQTTAKPNNSKPASKVKPTVSSSITPPPKPDKKSLEKDLNESSKVSKTKEKKKKKKRGEPVEIEEEIEEEKEEEKEEEEEEEEYGKVEYHELEILKYAIEYLDEDPEIDPKTREECIKWLYEFTFPKKPLPVAEAKKIRRQRVVANRTRSMQEDNEQNK